MSDSQPTRMGQVGAAAAAEESDGPMTKLTASFIQLTRHGAFKCSCCKVTTNLSRSFTVHIY